MPGPCAVTIVCNTDNNKDEGEGGGRGWNNDKDKNLMNGESI